MPTKLLSALVFTGALVFANPAHASTVCLDGGCDYTSIETAAFEASRGETITVSPGTYYEHGIQTGELYVTIQSEDGNPETTVIDGGGSGTVFIVNRGTLRGLTVQNGDARMSSYDGGGLLADTNVLVENCVFRLNWANQGVGGAIRSIAGLVVIDSVIDRNFAGVAGAGIQSQGDVTLINTHVTNNIVDDDLYDPDGGGGIAVRYLTMSGGSVSGNMADDSEHNGRIDGGGILVTYGGWAKLTNVTVSGNQVSGVTSASGGGIYSPGASLTLVGCTIDGNTAAGIADYSQGGGITVASAHLEGVTFSNNTAEGGQGGGVFDGAGIFGITYEGVTIAGNTAPEGAGIYCYNREIDRRFTGTLADEATNCFPCTGSDSQACNTGLPAACAAGTQTCNALQMWGDCVPTVAPNQVDEDCDDSTDNDCDGLTDTDDPDCQTTQSRGRYDGSGNSAEPVNTFTGELYNHYPADLALPGRIPLVFARYYASGLEDLGLSGALGTNWRHSLEWQLLTGGGLLEITDPRGRVIRFEDVSSNWVLSGWVDVPYAVFWDVDRFVLNDPETDRVYLFDSTGLLMRIEDTNGNGLDLTYNGTELATVTDGNQTLTFSHSGGLMTEVTDGTRTVYFTHTGSDLTGVTDARGMTTGFAYDAAGRMTSWTLPEANTPYTQTFHTDGRVETQTDAYSNAYTFSYDDGAGLTTIDGPESTTRVHTHSIRGELTSIQMEDSTSFSMGYDGTGRRDQIVDRFGDTTLYEYHEDSGELSAVTGADGETTRYTRIPVWARGHFKYEVSAIDHPDGTSESFAYDARGNLVGYTDQAGHTSTFVYDDHGQILEALNVATGLSTFTWNDDGTVATSTDPATNEISYGYDELGRLTSVALPDSTSRDYTWDEVGHLLTAMDGESNTTTFTYDDNGNLVEIEDRLTNPIGFAYDDLDRLVTVTDAFGESVATTYDAFGRVDTVTDRADNVVTYGYDTRGRLTSVTDGATQVWAYAYDVESVLTSVTDPLTNTVTFVSDEMGRTTQIVSPLTLTTDIAYDSMGRVTSITNPETEVTAYTWDERGLLASMTVGTLVASYERNALGLITVVTDPSTATWETTYDSSGRVVTRVDPLGNVLTVEYDPMNRPSRVTFPGSLGYVDLTRDGNGNVTSRAYSTGWSLPSGYDLEERLVSSENLSLAYDANGAVVDSNGIGIERDLAGRIWRVTYDTGKVVTYTYDGRNLADTITDWQGGVTTFTYDDAGRLVGIERPNGIDVTYSYDDDSRRTSITESDSGTRSTIALTYDGAGRITGSDRDVPLPAQPTTASVTTLAFDTASQVSSATYDALGRLTDDGTRTYSWDLAGRMTGTSGGGADVSFESDGLGHRVSRTAGGVTRDYVWSYALGLPSIAIEAEAGADVRYHIYAPDGRLLYSVDAVSDARTFYHFDEMGNVIYTTDDSGAEVGAWAWTPYGTLLASSGSTDVPFTWQGEYGVLDEGNGLFYARARTYDAATRRFLSRDPVASLDPREINPYQLARGNPSTWRDPTGRNPERYRKRWHEEASLTLETPTLNDLGKVGLLLIASDEESHEYALAKSKGIMTKSVADLEWAAAENERWNRYYDSHPIVAEKRSKGPTVYYSVGQRLQIEPVPPPSAREAENKAKPIQPDSAVDMLHELNRAERSRDYRAVAELFAELFDATTGISSADVLKAVLQPLIDPASLTSPARPALPVDQCVDQLQGIVVLN